MRAGLYARVSTDDKGQNPELQLEKLRAYCKAKGWFVSGEFVDKLSGTGKVERPEFNRLMDCAKKKELDVIVVWKVDRFSREGSLKTLNYIKKLNDSGVKFVSITEEFLSSTGTFGEEVLLPLLAWIAKEESRKISERVKLGIEKRRQKRKPIGKASLSAKMEKKGVQARIIELYNQGLTYRQIREQTTYRTKKGLLRRVSLGFVHKCIAKAKEEEKGEIEHSEPEVSNEQAE